MAPKSTKQYNSIKQYKGTKVQRYGTKRFHNDGTKQLKKAPQCWYQRLQSSTLVSNNTKVQGYKGTEQRYSTKSFHYDGTKQFKNVPQ